jgi:hypothetical protein
VDVAATVVTVRVDTAAGMLARARRVVLRASTLLSCEYTPHGRYVVDDLLADTWITAVVDSAAAVALPLRKPSEFASGYKLVRYMAQAKGDDMYS